MPAMKLDRPERWAAVAASVLLLLLAAYVYFNRYVHGYGLVGGKFWQAIFWDARVFEVGGRDVFQNENPYLGFVYHIPFDLPFISPPQVAWAFGVAAGVLGGALLPLLAFTHLLSMVITPLILARRFLGTDWEHKLLGYALFICGLGAWGVTTIIAGNFGATLYLLIFLGIERGVRKDSWTLFHVAVALAVQVKPPYALLWVVPVMLNGWSWRQTQRAALAAALSMLPYVASYILAPDFFASWLEGLQRQVEKGDVGFSMYGAVFSIVWPNVNSPLPTIAHAIVCAGLGSFLILDKTRGNLRLAALIVFAIVANPRMKEYDMAFAAIPVAALYLSAFTPEAAGERQRLIALAGMIGVMLAMLKGDHLPLIGHFIYAIAMAGAILSLAAPKLWARWQARRAAA